MNKILSVYLELAAFYFFLSILAFHSRLVFTGYLNKFGLDFISYKPRRAIYAF